MANATTYSLNNYVTPTANAAVAPDGTTTAALYAATTDNQLHYRGVGGAVISCPTGSATASVYIKSAGQRYAISNCNGNSGTFDLLLGTASGTGASISYVGNGWYRCSITSTYTSGTLSYWVFQVGTATFSGDGVSGIYLWGAQIGRAHV